ncbi:uncharacterized protein EKO05_0002357 [Ascochyta rabiei]|uniref:Uncharacterized protein n=1 Tax=Didymella rabiei TaxID=5454 RepID=A0A162VRB4_DIDRA|nr:uncharacterized protein EKO05_0002357 [Ascochyta rabiei]KZM18588.1 hypothetical protein ST47_g10305 [Ascochyta rabiei]UPX11767.1 hypothetical protein EKO05_0002357 [Ascochyta rabiei]
MSGSEMQLAEILSDLVSLRPGVCDPTAALSLVSLRASPAPTNTAPANQPLDVQDGDKDDADLQRARDLVTLHYEVRVRCKTGELGRGLEGARRDVERALSG